LCLSLSRSSKRLARRYGTRLSYPLDPDLEKPQRQRKIR
jgi:hypothetical protein